MSQSRSERPQRVTEAMVDRAGKAIGELLHQSAGQSTIRSDVETSVLQIQPGQVDIATIARVALKAGLEEAEGVG